MKKLVSIILAGVLCLSVALYPSLPYDWTSESENGDDSSTISSDGDVDSNSQNLVMPQDATGPHTDVT